MSVSLCPSTVCGEAYFNCCHGNRVLVEKYRLKESISPPHSFPFFSSSYPGTFLYGFSTCTYNNNHHSLLSSLPPLAFLLAFLHWFELSCWFQVLCSPFLLSLSNPLSLLLSLYVFLRIGAFSIPPFDVPLVSLRLSHSLTVSRLVSLLFPSASPLSSVAPPPPSFPLLPQSVQLTINTGTCN